MLKILPRFSRGNRHSSCSNCGQTHATTDSWSSILFTASFSSVVWGWRAPSHHVVSDQVQVCSTECRRSCCASSSTYSYLTWHAWWNHRCIKTDCQTRRNTQSTTTMRWMPSATAWLPDNCGFSLADCWCFQVSNPCLESHLTVFMLWQIEILHQNCIFLWNLHDYI